MLTTIQKSLKSHFRPENAIELGRIQNGLGWREYLTEGQLNHHVHVVGASGFGKTVLLSHIIRQMIAQGKGLLFIDLKADIETVMEVTRFCADSNRLDDLRFFSCSNPKISFPYNLVADGSATQLRDRIMVAFNWSEEYYRNQASSFLLKLLMALCWLRDNRARRFSLAEILNGTSNIDFVEELALQIPEEAGRAKMAAEEVVHFLRDKEHHRSLQGLRNQLESILLSDFGDLVVPREGASINLFEAVQQGQVVYVLLDSRRYGETAAAVGRLIIQDLKATSARIDAEIEKKDRKPFAVIIDEFADLATEDFIGFLDRARSSRMSVVVAHQEISDLNRISPEFAGRLMGNTSTLYAFLQKRPESAEIIAGIAGTKPVKEETHQYDGAWFFSRPTGMKSVKEVEAYAIHPNVIKSLRVGECVRIGKYPKVRADLIRVNY